MKPGGLILGVDVGGTFADVICVGPGGLTAHKTPSRPDEPGADVVEGLAAVATDLGLKDVRELLARTDVIFHGSTVATNTLLTSKGARVGLLTTRGFRDIVEMRGGRREATFDSHMPNATPLAPRELRFEIVERTDRDGAIIERPSRSEVHAAVDALVEGGAGALAIAFKHSAVNPANEAAAAAWVRARAPDMFVSASAELSRRPRLYDRTSTAVVNAYVGPPTTEYVKMLRDRLADLGFTGQLLIMAGGGGLMSPAEAARVPVNLILSGPAAGPVAATLSLSATGQRDAILADMGGTSFDVSVIRGGVVETTTSRDVSRYRIGLPMLDIHTIGAGGGSIATLDSAGLLSVGPDSAGAIPGPAAYGLGGLDPTLTDANLVAGYLNPSAVLGSVRRLSRPLARSAVARIARRLGLSPEACASGIRAVANGSMVAAVREMTVGRGLDPRTLSLIVGGGAGPLHGAEIAQELGIGTVIIPSHAGVLCAVGMAASDVEYESAVSVVRSVPEIDRGALRRKLVEVRDQLRQRLMAASVNSDQIVEKLLCEARYEGQFHELLVSATLDELTGANQARLVNRFHAAHEAAYGFRSDAARVQIVNVRVKQTSPLPVPARHMIQQARGGLRLVAIGGRQVFVAGGSTPVHAPVLAAVGPGAATSESRSRGPGPALIDLATTTVFVPAAWSFRVTSDGDIRMTRRPREGAA